MGLKSVRPISRGDEATRDVGDTWGQLGQLTPEKIEVRVEQVIVEVATQIIPLTELERWKSEKFPITSPSSYLHQDYSEIRTLSMLPV